MGAASFFFGRIFFLDKCPMRNRCAYIYYTVYLFASAYRGDAHYFAADRRGMDDTDKTARPASGA